MSQRIVILGGGFSGLCAAQRLNEGNNEIHIIDNYWLNQGIRRGIPQGNHLHVLLMEGQRLLEILFPGILNELIAYGAQTVDWSQETSWQGPFGHYPQYPSSVKTLLFSRHLLNEVMYQRFNQSHSVHFITGKVIDVKISNQIVKSVHYRVENKIRQLEGDLFIEARGRGSNLTNLLEKYSLQIEKKVIMNTTQYLSIRIPAQYVTLPHCKQCYFQADGNNNSLGYVLSPIENDHYILTCISTVKNKFKDIKSLPPLLSLYKNTGLEKLVDREAKSLHYHFFYDLSNERKAYSFLNLTNLLVVGDALCYLNPVYGQGMTVALKQIFALCNKPKENYSRQQKLIEKKISIPWLLAVSEDLRWQRNKPIGIFFMNKILNLLLKGSTKSEHLHHFFLKIIHMTLVPHDILKFGNHFKRLS